MKLVIIILTTAILQVSAATFAQKVTLRAIKQPLESVLKSIRLQTGFDYVADEQLLDNAPKVTVDIQDTELNDALKAIFKDQPLTYSLDNKTIILKKSQQSTPETAKPAPANIDVTGRVVDENNQPLAGATIRVKNDNGSTITDANGLFTIKQINPAAIVTISFIGYITAEYKVKPEIGVIRMSKSTDKLDEVQVIFSGQTTQRLNTGNVTHISTETISKQPVGNVMAAIEGRVPGLFIQQQSGLPGAGFAAQIRGKASLNNTSNPLIVIDGVPYNPSLLYPGTANGDQGTSSVGSPLNFINPSDIESIDVLKDADATAIYGSRGANGVILITSKKGKAGELRFNASVTAGVSKKPKLSFLNTDQYLQMRKEAYRNDGVTGLPDNAYDLNGTWATNGYTDWQKVLVGNTAHYTDAQLSLSGGNGNTTYLIGGNFHRETTIFPNSKPDQNGGLHFNLRAHSNNNKLKISLTGSFMGSDNESITSDLSAYIDLAPNAPSLYTSTGGLNFANSTWTNPLSYNGPAFLKTKTLTSSSVFSYEFLPGFNAEVTLGYDFTQLDNHISLPLALQDPAYGPVNDATFIASTSNSITLQPQLNYLKVMGKSTLNAIIGANVEQRKTNGTYIDASNYPSDLQLGSPSGATSIDASGYNLGEYKYNAIYARVNYNYDDKYIINLNGRRDGSSRFGPGNQFANFGSIGAAWIITKENWLQLPVIISFGKIRASYGLTGNDQIGDYKYLNLYSNNPSTFLYQGATGISPTSLNNPEYAWETNKKLNLGIDLGFFRDRLNISADYYVQRSSNQLTRAPLPAFVGPGSVTINFPAVIQNTGFDLIISSTNIQKENFSWKTTFNFSENRNKLVSYPGLASSSLAATYAIGQPITARPAYHVVGVNPATGLFEFIDSKGNLTYTPSSATDKTTFIETLGTPRFYGGFENIFHYQCFEASFFLEYVALKTQDPYFSKPPGWNNNILTTVSENLWHQPGDVARYEKTTSTSASAAYRAYSNAANSDYASVNANYVRLKNVSLYYNLPSRTANKFHLNALRIFVQGQNLYTFTGLNSDPALANYYTTPLLRTMVIGTQITL